MFNCVYLQRLVKRTREPGGGGARARRTLRRHQWRDDDEAGTQAGTGKVRAAGARVRTVALAREFVQRHPHLYPRVEEGVPNTAANADRIVETFRGGVGFADLDHVEAHFGVKINVYRKHVHAGTGRVVASLVRRGDERYKDDAIDAEMRGYHFAYICAGNTSVVRGTARAT